MKKILGILSLAAIALLFACNQAVEPKAGASQNAAAEPKNEVDGLFEEIMVFHDEAMPKMGKLKGYEDLARLRIDSLAKRQDEASKTLKAGYEKLVADLQKAQQGMNNWMDGFEPDKYADKDSLMQYYEAQKAAARIMRNDIFNVLDSAKARFGN